MTRNFLDIKLIRFVILITEESQENLLLRNAKVAYIAKDGNVQKILEVLKYMCRNISLFQNYKIQLGRKFCAIR